MIELLSSQVSQLESQVTLLRIVGWLRFTLVGQSRTPQKLSEKKRWQINSGEKVKTMNSWPLGSLENLFRMVSFTLVGQSKSCPAAPRLQPHSYPTFKGVLVLVVVLVWGGAQSNQLFRTIHPQDIFMGFYGSM
jgi:hypothetical protein